MSLTVNYCLRWIFEAIYTLMWFLVLNKTLKPRYSLKIIHPVQFIWFISYMIVNRMLPYMSFIRMVLFATILVFISIACYTDPWPKVLFSVAMIFMVLITNELLGVGLYFPEEALSGNQESLSIPAFIQFWSLYLSTGAVLYFLLYLFLNRQRFQMRAPDWGLFALFPASQYILMYGWLDVLRVENSSSRNVFFILVVFACITADIGLFAAVIRISQRAQLAAENSMLSSQVDYQEKHYQALTAQYENIRRMRHDIANHLNAMESLLSSGRSDEAQEYLQELNSTPFDSTLGMCEHPVADAFLHSKIEAARSLGISVEAKISLPAGIPVSNVDLIRIFGNLIDNAIEACAGQDKPWLSISCTLSRACLIISTSNPAPPSTGKKRRRIPELDRGIGKAVLSDIAKKYNGSINLSEKEGVFSTELILSLDYKRSVRSEINA